MTEQKTRSKERKQHLRSASNRIDTTDLDEDQWGSVLVQARNDEHQATISDIAIMGEKAYIEFEVDGFEDRQFVQKLDASIHPDQQSELESLLQQHGYSPYEPTEMIGDNIPVTVGRIDGNIEISIPELQDQDDETRVRDTVFHLAQATVFGLMPIVNLLILASILFGDDLEADEDEIETIIVTMGLTLGCSLTYLVGPLLYYILTI